MNIEELLNREFDKFRDFLNNHTNRHESLLTKLEKLVTDINTALGDLTTAIQDAINRAAGDAAIIADLQAKLDASTATNADLQTQLTAATDANAATATQLETLAGQVAAIDPPAPDAPTE